jgi:hypothetical protein
VPHVRLQGLNGREESKPCLPYYLFRLLVFIDKQRYRLAQARLKALRPRQIDQHNGHPALTIDKLMG